MSEASDQRSPTTPPPSNHIYLLHGTVHRIGRPPLAPLPVRVLRATETETEAERLFEWYMTSSSYANQTLDISRLDLETPQ
jgi:hypothetical protein